MNNDTDKESRKCYILLFTCCFSRSINLELTTDISSKTLLLALRRFISKRGCQKIIVSDHFKSFKSDKVKLFVASKGITWNFILELSPWCGVFYERLSAIVKNSLKKILRKNKFNSIELTTILQEAESVFNSRPLTYLNEDCFKESLSPNHIIHGRNISNHCDEEIQSKSVTAKDVQNLCKHTDIVFKHLIQRSKNEYLLVLLEKRSYVKRNIKQPSKLVSATL